MKTHRTNPFSHASTGANRRRWVGTARRLAVALTGLLLLAGITAWESDSRADTVPKTFDGAGDSFRQGGRDMGEGFRGFGRGVRDTFTGRSSGEDYRESARIGTGFKNFGLGIAGGGRAIGRGFKRAFTGSAD